MTRTKDQKISDSTPSTCSGVTAMSGTREAGRHGVQGTGADVAEHDAERRERHGREPSTRIAFARHLYPLHSAQEKGPPRWALIWLGD